MTKLDKVVLGSAEGETIRKMIIAMARDPRVLVIKVADRLHNMRTMRFLPPEKQARKARETLEVIAPLAHRLGMATVKWELEDLSFAILHPKRYEEIVRLVADRAPSRDTYLAKVRAEINTALSGMKIHATVEGRPKHYWSIYQKMIVKGRDFDDIHDLVGVRILCDEIRDCYAAVGVVHSLWQPMPGRFWGPHRPAALWGVPVAAHHRGGAGGAAGGTDPHPRHAPDRRVRDRGALALQGGQVNATAWFTHTPPPRSTTWPGCVSCWIGSVRRPTPVSSSSRCVTTWPSRRSSCSPPSGDVITLPTGSTPVDFRLRRTHRGGAPLYRCPGQRTAGRPGAQAGERRGRRGLHFQSAQRRAVAGLAELRGLAPGEGQDPAVVRQGAPGGGA